MRILVFGPHPDDAEIGAGGIMALASAEGHDVLICDLTRGEMASNGTPERRAGEAAEAAGILGVHRVCLGLPDQGLADMPGQAGEVARLVRDFRPDLALVPHGEDRHVDHRAAAGLCLRGLGLAGLARYVVGGRLGEGHRGDGGGAGGARPHRTPLVRLYLVHSQAQPGIVVDITSVWERKMQALRCYGTQFRGSAQANPTPLNTGSFLQMVEARDAYFGALAGVGRAEGLIALGPRLVRQVAEV